MLEEVISVSKVHRKSKTLSPSSNLTHDLPDVDSKISFVPFIDYLKNKRPLVSGSIEKYYDYLIDKFKSGNYLLNSVDALHENGEQSVLLETLTTSLFPLVAEHEKISFALAAPYQFEVFYYSDSFRKLFIDENEKHLLLPLNITIQQLKEIECAMIYDHVLEKFYGIKLNDSPELIYPIADPATGLKRYYRIRYDHRFIDIHLTGKLPPIQNCAVCLNTFRILDLEKQLTTMPLDLFEVEGFAVWVAEDVTVTQSLDTIKKILLRQNACDTGIINELKAAVHALVGLNAVEIGLIPFLKVNDEFVLDDECASYGIISKHWKSSNADNVSTFKMCLDFLSQMPQPIPISILNEEMVQRAPFLKHLYENGTKGYLIYPMQNSDGLLGILELATPVPNIITYEILTRLEPAIPLLSVAMLKNRDAFHSRIERFIKEKFTALQQPVEWKFVEIAWNHFKHGNNVSETPNVVFENVYPLYGAIDIRNSSHERSRAMQKDLEQQLLLVDDILGKSQQQLQLPLLEGLKFKNQTFLKSIKEVMAAEDEMRINDFLQHEAEPLFTHLQKNNKSVEDVMNNYFTMVNDNKGKLYHHRNEYEETLATINNAVLNCLEQQEEAIQKSYPHYFEKYRTDGVEYNIYIGQSIAPHRPFDLLYLKNIRLWQLRSMAEAAKITHRLMPSLKVPLQTTQLILIHSQSIAISFRRDERRFDVEGSYNIRYEVIKKRLDKAVIKDTQDRLTQPGKIAMVYSNQRDLQEYREYIDFLQNQNILKPGIELLEIEELQGVRGLKAMRVEVNLD